MKIADFRLERFFARHEFSAPYLLCSSDCESWSVEELLSLEEGSLSELRALRLGYTESLGHPALREELARLYERMGADDIIVFSGAEEAIFIFMNVALGKGDHVIVQFPAYQSLYEVADSIGCRVTRWVMDERKGLWHLDMDLLERLIEKDTRAIIINTPHNPTGHLMLRADYERLIEIAAQKGITLFCDEVYRMLEHDCSLRLPALCDCLDKGISLGVMSKSLGLAGLRIGWVATADRDLRRKMASFKDYTTICSSAPSELLSMIALRNRDKLLARNLSIISLNMELLSGFFREYGHLFRWAPPRAGSIAFPSLLFEKNVLDFVTDLVEKKGVLLMPGTHYDFDERHFRIGFGRRNMPEALGRLEEYVKEQLAGQAGPRGLDN
ncbi:MAG: aminotransferase class I/II-fold pyridoxal phosphate-dependent enzyme [Candidatus Eremiobacteraeota bacterium]|nr:aminotransferase class I/II-fold pyridoxal phosphate-dependent enzyme [Candidatus Eremiobacteraeota bacterium]